MIQSLMIVANRWVMLPAAVNMVALAILAWWAFGPVSQPIEVLRPEAHSAQYLDDEATILVRRETIVHRPVSISVQRKLYRIDDNVWMDYVLPDLQVTVEPRENAQVERKVPVPFKLAPGTYELRSSIVYDVNPLRSERIPLPPVRFKVGG